MPRYREPWAPLCRWCHTELESGSRKRYCSDRCRDLMEEACTVVKLRRREIDSLPPTPCAECEQPVDRLGTVYVQWTRDTVHLPGVIGWACCSWCIKKFNYRNREWQLRERGEYDPRVRRIEERKES